MHGSSSFARLLVVLITISSVALGGCRSSKVASYDRVVGQRVADREPVGLAYIQTRHDGNLMAQAFTVGGASGAGAAASSLGDAIIAGLSIGAVGATADYATTDPHVLHAIELDRDVHRTLVSSLRQGAALRVTPTEVAAETTGFDADLRKPDGVLSFLDRYNLDFALGVQLHYTHRDTLPNHVAIYGDWTIYDRTGEPAIRVTTFEHAEADSALLPNTLDPKYGSDYRQCARQSVERFLSLLEEAHATKLTAAP
ncbi:MAG: hypothetical protein AAGE65_13530 [Planctomycetota bacterium]